MIKTLSKSMTPLSQNARQNHRFQTRNPRFQSWEINDFKHRNQLPAGHKINDFASHEIIDFRREIIDFEDENH